MPHGTAIFDRSDQINQNSRAVTVPPRGTGQTDSKASLNDVERSGCCHLAMDEQPNLLSVCDVFCGVIGGAERDRTADLKLAKLPLSQLSYGPLSMKNGGPGTTRTSDLTLIRRTL